MFKNKYITNFIVIIEIIVEVNVKIVYNLIKEDIVVR